MVYLGLKMEKVNNINEIMISPPKIIPGHTKIKNNKKNPAAFKNCTKPLVIFNPVCYLL